MNEDRPLLGIMLMLGFCLLAPLGNSIAKYLGGVVPLFQLMLARFAVQWVILTPVYLRQRGPISRRVLKFSIIRTALHIVGITAMFASLRYLPLANAVAIAFVMPFILLLLGKFVSGEEVGPRRLIACCVGFIGTLMVVQPSFSQFGAPALLPLVVAVIFALYMMVTRKIAKEVEPISLQFISGGIGVLMLCAVWLVFGGLHADMEVKAVSGESALLLLMIGVLGTLAHLLMTWSLKFAPSATLAPMQYLEIPFATLIGWLIFSDFPNGLALAGIAVTMASGLYVIYRASRQGG